MMEVWDVQMEGQPERRSVQVRGAWLKVAPLRRSYRVYGWA